VHIASPLLVIRVDHTTHQEVIAGQLFLIRHYTHKSPEAVVAVEVAVVVSFSLMVASTSVLVVLELLAPKQVSTA
jgi:hypothetical protein